MTAEGFAESGRNIPLLIGSNLNEWNFSMTGVPQDEAATLNALKRSQAEQAGAILAAFKTAYPNVPVGNATLLDTMLRAPLVKIAAHKANQGGAAVYSYLMTYGAPRATHGAEIPLIFGTAAEGDGEMSALMGKIWAQFARTGNPSVEGLPSWNPFTRENGAVMVLDRQSYLSEHHDETLLRLLKTDYEW